MKKKFGIILAGILCYGAFIIYASQQTQDNQHQESLLEVVETNTLSIVTSFYPMTLHTEQLIQGTNHQLVTMANQTAGCLHDYQLTVNDAKKIHGADILIINGMGAEGFMDKAYEQNSELKIIDSSEQYEHMLMGIDEYGEGDTDLYPQLQEAHVHTEDCSHEEEHVHTDECTHEEEHIHTGECTHEEEHVHTDECTHEEEHIHTDECTHEEEHIHTDECTHEEEHVHTDICEGHSHGAYNTHVWMSLEGSIYQIKQISQQLQQQDPENKAIYVENEKNYLQELEKLQHEIEETIVEISQTPVVSVHDSFDYLIPSLGLNLVDTIPEGVHDTASPKEIEEIIDNMELHDVRIILTDEQFEDIGIVQMIQEETDAQIVVLDMMLVEQQSLNAQSPEYIERMKQNIAKIKEASLYE